MRGTRFGQGETCVGSRDVGLRRACSIPEHRSVCNLYRHQTLRVQGVILTAPEFMAYLYLLDSLGHVGAIDGCHSGMAVKQ